MVDSYEVASGAILVVIVGSIVAAIKCIQKLQKQSRASEKNPEKPEDLEKHEEPREARNPRDARRVKEREDSNTPGDLKRPEISEPHLLIGPIHTRQEESKRPGTPEQHVIDPSELEFIENSIIL